MPSRGSVHRVPQQARSRATVRRILDAAGKLFAEAGYEATTTNHIAARAGVSVGSLYQFFVDKQAILGTLQSEWVVRLGAALDETLRPDDPRDIEEIVASVLDVHARLNAEEPGLLAVLLTKDTGSTGHSTVVDTVQRRLEELLAARAPALDGTTRRIAAGMLIHLSLALYTLPKAVHATYDDVREEVRRALVTYFNAVIRDTR